MVVVLTQSCVTFQLMPVFMATAGLSSTSHKAMLILVLKNYNKVFVHTLVSTHQRMYLTGTTAVVQMVVMFLTTLKYLKDVVVTRAHTEFIHLMLSVWLVYVIQMTK